MLKHACAHCETRLSENKMGEIQYAAKTLNGVLQIGASKMGASIAVAICNLKNSSDWLKLMAILEAELVVLASYSKRVMLRSCF